MWWAGKDGGEESRGERGGVGDSREALPAVSVTTVAAGGGVLLLLLADNDVGGLCPNRFN